MKIFLNNRVCLFYQEKETLSFDKIYENIPFSNWTRFEKIKSISNTFLFQIEHVKPLWIGKGNFEFQENKNHIKHFLYTAWNLRENKIFKHSKYPTCSRVEFFKNSAQNPFAISIFQKSKKDFHIRNTIFENMFEKSFHNIFPKHIIFWLIKSHKILELHSPQYFGKLYETWFCRDQF